MGMQVVRIDDKGRALDHVVKVNKPNHDNVMWVALGNGGPWRITFDKVAAGAGGNGISEGSPFSRTEYLVDQGNFVITMNGPTAGAVVGNTYKYNVRDANTNVIKDDPDVDVDP